MKVLPSSSPTITADGSHVGGTGNPGHILAKRGHHETRRSIYVSLGPVLWGQGTTASKILTLASKVSPTLNRTNSRSLRSVMASTRSSFMLLTNAAKGEHAGTGANDKGRAPEPHSKVISPNPNTYTYIGP